SDERLDADDGKVSGGHACASQLLGLTRAGKCHRRLSERSDVFEDGVLFLPVEEVCGRSTPATVSRHILPKRDEPLRLFVRQRVEQDGVNDTEDRSVRSD